MGTANEKILRKAGYFGTMFGGIDVGTLDGCGWAYVDIAGEYIKSGVFNLSEFGDLYDRLAALGTSMRGIARMSGNTIMYGIEDPWINPRNPQVGLKLAKAWGVIFDCMTSSGYEAMPISVSEAKLAMTGDGAADKEKVLRFAQQMNPNITQFDESDAVAVALATRAKILKEAMHGKND